MKKLLALSALSLVLGIASISRADDSKIDQPKSAGKSDARFMLRGSNVPSTISKSEPSAEDFAWKSLTQNGAANGSDPAIGKNSGKSYYDFKDGQPFPYYVAAKAK